MLEDEKRRAETEDMEERIVIHMSSHHWTTQMKKLCKRMMTLYKYKH